MELKGVSVAITENYDTKSVLSGWRWHFNTEKIAAFERKLCDMEKHLNYRDLEMFPSLYDYLLGKWCFTHIKQAPHIFKILKLVNGTF